MEEGSLPSARHDSPANKRQNRTHSGSSYLGSGRFCIDLIYSLYIITFPCNNFYNVSAVRLELRQLRFDFAGSDEPRGVNRGFEVRQCSLEFVCHLPKSWNLPSYWLRYQATSRRGSISGRTLLQPRITMRFETLGRRASDNERRIDKGDDKGEPADWRPVVERATRVLAEKTKDLELAAYLIEALVRTKGFPGLRDGYRLARELVERFWEGLYPTAQDSEVQERFSHILHLNGLEGPGALIVPVRKIAMTAATSVGTFNLTHLQQARSLSQIADAKVRQKRIDEGAITLEMIQTAVAETPSQFYADLVQDLNRAGDEFRRFLQRPERAVRLRPPFLRLAGRAGVVPGHGPGPGTGQDPQDSATCCRGGARFGPVGNSGLRTPGRSWGDPQSRGRF